MYKKDTVFCKKCLLSEASMQEASDKVKRYVDRIDGDIRTPKEEYENRLAFCKKCDDLISGTCLKCGCFVEMRAAVINKGCPNVPSKW